jgi:hypothetical protein
MAQRTKPAAHGRRAYLRLRFCAAALPSIHAGAFTKNS